MIKYKTTSIAYCCNTSNFVQAVYNNIAGHFFSDKIEIC